MTWLCVRIPLTAPARNGWEPEIQAPFEGYLALVIFVLSLLTAIFQPFGKMPVQTVLVAGAILMIIVGRIRLTDLMEGIILLPVTAMAAGFLAAGALAATGGFDALGVILNSFVQVPFLGVAGMLAIFVQFQTISAAVLCTNPDSCSGPGVVLVRAGKIPIP